MNENSLSYAYNATGERIMKSYGTMEGVYINGAPQGITFHKTDNFTLYPASIISINKNRFTKHYFLGDKRVASRIGTGLFNNVYGRNGSYVTAGQQDYAERMNQIQKQKEAYYKQQGIAPGVPTMKGAYGDPENTGVGYNAVLTELGNHDVPQGWIQTPKPNTTPDTNPGPPVSWNDPSNPDDPQAGYGYIPNDTTKEETFFYHSDHLGSTSYITDEHANITQYDAYLPYGELLVDEHSSSEDLPYKFNGKQFDEETGLYYYGARYMNPITSLWYGVDPLFEKYPTESSFIYCLDNPIILFDKKGKFPSKAAAIISRAWYNLWHKDAAGPIIENKNASNPQFRYTYSSYEGSSNGFEITLHYRFSTDFVKGMQDAGDGAALAGYGLTLTGAGAEVGVPLAGIGEVVSLVGSLSEILLDFANGDYGNSIKGLIYKGGEELVGMGLNKVLPGYGKKIGEEGFDLGTEVIRQGVNLKLSGVERLTDKLIEEKENIRSNQNKD